MSTPMEQTDSPRLKPRPFSEPAIDEKVGGLKPELVDIWSQRCAFVVDEILRTERDYVEALHDIIQGYRGPLVLRLKSSSDTQKLINNLFSNIDELHGLHLSLLKKLEAHDTEPHEFGQVFIRTEEGFQLYTAYCTNYNSAMLCLQKLLLSEKHNQFLDQCRRNLRHTLPLSAQLIKPVQRITRYHLLLHDLVKHFNPNHYGYPSIKQAHKAMARIADHINKVKKQEENARRVEDLKTSLYGWKGNEGDDNLSVYGELLLESTCFVGAKKGIERQVLLFEKLLLILKKKDVKRYNYKAHILANELCLDDQPPSTNHTSFKVFSKNRRHIIYTIDPRNNSKRVEWVNAISDLVRRMAEQFPQNLEDEYGQFIKRQKLDELVTESQRSPVPQRIESPVRVLMERTNTDIHGRIPSLRKRRRPDVREVFGQEEGGVQLLNIRRAVTSETTYQVPQPAPITTPELASDEEMEEPSSGVTLGKRAESVESLLSLSDVEVGVEEHAGVLEEVDHPRRKIRRRKTDLRRRQAIMVKRSPSNLESSISTRIKIKAKEAKQDVQEAAGYDDVDRGGDILSDEDTTELARLVGPAHPMDSSMDQDSLFDSSMDSSALGQSIEGGGGAMGVASVEGMASTDTIPAQVPDVGVEMMDEPSVVGGAVSQEGGVVLDSVVDSGVHSEPTLSMRKISTGPPIEIIHDYMAAVAEASREERVEEEEDEAFAMVLQDAGIGDSPIPDGVMVMIDDDKRGDIFIVEDSSTDSEDEEEESMANSYSSEIEGVPLIPPPLDFAGDQKVPDVQSDEEQRQDEEKDDIGDFFNTLISGATPTDISADVSTISHPQTSSEVQQSAGELEPHIFTGSRGEFAAESPALDRIRGTEIYATMPRNKKSRSNKTGSPLSSSPCVTPLGQRTPTAARKQLQSTSAQPHSRSAARRAEGFSELLQFTREQQLCSPHGESMDVSQSLPSFMSMSSVGSGGGSLRERMAPLFDDLPESSVDQGEQESRENDSNLEHVSKREDVARVGGRFVESSVSPELVNCPPITEAGEMQEEKSTVENVSKSEDVTRVGGGGWIESSVSPEPVIAPPPTESSEQQMEKSTVPHVSQREYVTGGGGGGYIESSVSPEPAIAPPPTESSEQQREKSTVPHVSQREDVTGGGGGRYIESSVSPEPVVTPSKSENVTKEGSGGYIESIVSPEPVISPPTPPTTEDREVQRENFADEKEVSVTEEDGGYIESSVSPEPAISTPPPPTEVSEQLRKQSTDENEMSDITELHVVEGAKVSETHAVGENERGQSAAGEMIPPASALEDISESEHNATTPPLADSKTKIKGEERETRREITDNFDLEEAAEVEDQLTNGDVDVDIKPHDSSVDSEDSTATTVSSDREPASDTSQRNGSQHGQHKTTDGNYESELKLDSGVRTTETASNKSSERTQGTAVVRQVAAGGMFGWVRGYFRRGLRAFLPPVGLRGGLVAVGVAAVSSFVIYAMTTAGSADSAFLPSAHPSGGSN